MEKIKVAFIKFGGMANGGTEKYLQTIAAHLPKDEFQVDFFYCDAAPYIGSDFKHLDTDESRVEYTKSHGVNLIKFDVEFKDVTKPTHDWVNTNFFDLFNEDNYDGFPLSPYASSKKSAEEMCRVYSHLFDINTVVLRFFTVYGPAGRPDMSIFRFVKWVIENQEIQ